MNQDYLIAYHIERMSHLQWTGKLAELNKYLEQQSSDIQQQLKFWHQHLVQRFDDDNNDLNLPDMDKLRILGWQQFYQHQYEQALTFFEQTLQAEHWQIYAIDTALGLAKVYTRTGHWALARDWCLYYLHLARKHLTAFDIAKGYGALAEIFLRANQPNEALACFQIAYHLMPLQHGQQARQYNFMASALMRNKEWLRAEVLLHTSQQMSKNQLKIDQTNPELLASRQHSEMRLAFLDYLQQKCPRFFTDEHMLSMMEKPTGLQILPIGMLWIVKGLYDLRHGNQALANTAFIQAMLIFEHRMPMEYFLAKRLAGQFNPDDAKRLQAMFEIKQLDVPHFINVVDSTWQSVELNNQGFHNLLHENLANEDLLGLLKQFFI